MLEPGDIQRLCQASHAATRPLTIRVHPGAESPLAAHFAGIARQLAAVCPQQVLVREGAAEVVAGTPALVVTVDGLQVTYLAAIEGPEKAPFVELLERLVAGEPGPSPAGADSTDRPQLIVFVAAACHHCPRAVRAALAVALDDPRVVVSVVDSQLFPELARRYGVRSVPSTVVDGGLVLIGELDAADLHRVLSGRGTPGHRTALLRSLAESGRFDEAREMLAGTDGAVHFVSLWQQSTTSLRIALLLAAEKALDRDFSVLDPCVGGLLQLLGSADRALRGDTVDLLGRIGSDSALVGLRPLLDDPDPDVAEMVAEFLATDGRRRQPS
ncbi:MAG: thioredoxin family protein [Pseudomonadota bacterium]